MRIVFNQTGMYDIRRAPGVVAELDSLAERVANIANDTGEGTYVTGSRQGARRPQGRWRSSVVTGDAKAIVDNRKRNTLIRALGRIA